MNERDTRVDTEVRALAPEGEAGGSLAARLTRLGEGGAQVAGWVFDHFAPHLLARLRRRYGYLGEPEIEDLLQDTFVLALKDDGRLLKGWASSGLPEEVDGHGLARYLWDLACGLASNRRRSAAVRRVVSFPSGKEFPVASIAEQVVVERDVLQRLLSCLRASGTRTFLYFTLRYRDGLSPEQVAAATGWSKKATYKQRQALNEALERCRTRLGYPV